MENVIEQPILMDKTRENDENLAQISDEKSEKLDEVSLGLNPEEGSMIGKFKDANTLLSAYNSLQSEFTRKCQKLAELEKNQTEKPETETCKQFENLDDFISSNTDSDKYKKEITEILSTKEFDSLPNKYQVAYMVAKKSESELVKQLNDQNFLDNLVKNNPKIKEKIISDYLSSISNINPAPSIMSGSPTGVYFTKSDGKPKTIKEAGELLTKMLI